MTVMGFKIFGEGSTSTLHEACDSFSLLSSLFVHSLDLPSMIHEMAISVFLSVKFPHPFDILFLKFIFFFIFHSFNLSFPIHGLSIGKVHVYTHISLEPQNFRLVACLIFLVDLPGSSDEVIGSGGRDPGEKHLGVHYGSCGIHRTVIN